MRVYLALVPLTHSLYLNLYNCILQEGMDGITADDLKEQFQRHEGLLENLTLSIGKLV